MGIKIGLFTYLSSNILINFPTNIGGGKLKMARKPLPAPTPEDGQ
jgi:hypothetical protein